MDYAILWHLYAFIRNNDTKIKRAKGRKKCAIKHMLTFENYTKSALKNKAIVRIQLRFKSDGQNVYTEEITKIAIMNIKPSRVLLHINMEHQQ